LINFSSKSPQVRAKPKNRLYPELYNRAAEELASNKDRQYFLGHPGANYYYRPFIAGEAPLKAEITKVTQLLPGTRIREFLFRNNGGKHA
jgi:hypothetical protein